MEENKVYSIKGKVEIGTDEYRDLIEARLNLESEARAERNSRWNTENKLKEVSDKLNVVTNKMDKLLAFVNEKGLAESFKLWQFEKEREEE